MLSRLQRYYRKIERFPFNAYNRFRLKNKNFSIISKDCVGGVLAHDLGIRFDSPTINLWFTAPDFVKLCRDIKSYLSEPLIEDKSFGVNYPVGTLGDSTNKIRVNFLHYGSFEQAKAKWYERLSRIHWDNMFFIMTDGENCDENVARDFDSIPHKHKALLTYRELEGVRSAVMFKNIEHGASGIGAPHVFAYRSVFSLKRVIDEWDYVSFFNS